jgi:DNA processing protein
MLTPLDILTLLNLPRIGRKKIQPLVYTHPPLIKDDLKQLHTLVTKHVSSKITFSQLQKAYSLAQTTLTELKKHNIQLLIPTDIHFPPQLKSIPDPPVLLYAKGNVELLYNSNLVALIGTRSITPFGTQIGSEIAKKLAVSYVVVSGLALGCDTIAHQKCLEAKGKAIAVLPQGLDKIYPKQNEKLANQILSSGGCLLSEYNIGVRAQAYTFVERDRLQSGLSHAVIIIETGIKGGTMHTAKFAREQHRLLACVKPPESKISSSNEGYLSLLQSGAFPITITSDLELWLDTSPTSRHPTKIAPEIANLSEVKTKKRKEENFPEEIVQSSTQTELTPEDRRRIETNRQKAFEKLKEKSNKKVKK